MYQCHQLINGSTSTAGIRVNLLNKMNVLGNGKKTKKNQNFKVHLLKVIKVTAGGTTG